MTSCLAIKTGVEEGAGRKGDLPRQSLLRDWLGVSLLAEGGG